MILKLLQDQFEEKITKIQVHTKGYFQKNFKDCEKYNFGEISKKYYG